MRASVQFRSVARTTSGTTGVISKYPMTALAEARFRDWQVSKVGAKGVDCRFNNLDFVGGRGSGIVYKGRRFRDRRQILGGQGLVVAGEGYISADRILTVISGGPGVGVLGDRTMVIREGRNNDCASRRDRIRGPWIWISEWEESLRSLYTNGHRLMSGFHHSPKEFNRGETRGCQSLL
jgi:hypothetical protein